MKAAYSGKLGSGSAQEIKAPIKPANGKKPGGKVVKGNDLRTGK